MITNPSVNSMYSYLYHSVTKFICDFVVELTQLGIKKPGKFPSRAFCVRPLMKD